MIKDDAHFTSNAAQFSATVFIVPRADTRQWRLVKLQFPEQLIASCGGGVSLATKGVLARPYRE